MELVKYMASSLACFSRVRLVNDEQVMVSVAAESIRVVRMKWGGIVPAETLWEGFDRVQMGLMLRCSHEDAVALLDGFTGLVMLSTSAAHVKAQLDALDAETRPWRRTAGDRG
ncbi:MAG TPA: hypothetical protein VHG91_09635 [Longimicrobium sp.]|nr:hypothetical protein [Longimicrobium sp.]